MVIVHSAKKHLTPSVRHGCGSEVIIWMCFAATGPAVIDTPWTTRISLSQMSGHLSSSLRWKEIGSRANDLKRINISMAKEDKWWEWSSQRPNLDHIQVIIIKENQNWRSEFIPFPMTVLFEKRFKMFPQDIKQRANSLLERRKCSMKHTPAT